MRHIWSSVIQIHVEKIPWKNLWLKFLEHCKITDWVPVQYIADRQQQPTPEMQWNVSFADIIVHLSNFCSVVTKGPQEY